MLVSVPRQQSTDISDIIKLDMQLLRHRNIYISLEICHCGFI
ncbi:hypothetical protein CAter10_5004 [Collimonas arenae]|nr:hypothetical protein CAter10_5004 [Collimonas arenae]